MNHYSDLPSGRFLPHDVGLCRRCAGLVLCCLVLLGCAGTPDTVDPSASKIAQLRGDLRDLQDRSSVLSQNHDDLQAQISQMRLENANVQTVIQENWSEMRNALSRLKSSQRTEINQSVKNVAAANIRELEKLNAELTRVVRTVQEENKRLQQKVGGDLASQQQEVKAMRVQLNAYMDKADRLEKQLRIVSSGIASSSPSSSRPPAGSAKKSTKKPSGDVTRTGTPSSPDIDYGQGYEHTVASGETLWKIARDYKVAVQDILNVNPQITDTTLLKPGQKLFIPYRKSAE